MKYFSTFTGVGGFEIALQKLNHKCVGFSEIDKYAAAVLKFKFPNIKNYGDITTIRYEQLPDFDLLVGGTPCQDLSVAGKQKGLSGQRSGLFYKYIEILKTKKPRYFIWENVKGALSSNNGWDFAKIQIEFQEAGYDISWQVLNARYFGVPQNRERIFIIGVARGKRRPKIFSNRKNKEIYTDIQGKVSPTITKSYAKLGQSNPYVVVTRVPLKFLGRNQKNITGDYAYTLDKANTGGVRIDDHIRQFTPIECERLMSWPDDWTKYGLFDNGKIKELSKSTRQGLCGNGVVSEVVFYLLSLLK